MITAPIVYCIQMYAKKLRAQIAPQCHALEWTGKDYLEH
jgi:hypothetical protein